MFDFVPKFVMVNTSFGMEIALKSSAGIVWLNRGFLFYPGIEKQLSNYTYVDTYRISAYVHFSLVNNTLSFYGESNKQSIYTLTATINDSGTTYHYIAIG